jgi:transposase
MLLMEPFRPAPRYRPVDRDRCSHSSLDQLLPGDHEARAVWRLVQELDFSAFHARVKAVEGHPGRPPFRPDVLFALWLYACLRGIPSARALQRRCAEDLPFQWLCGAELPDYHTLADFYSDHAERLHELFVSHVAALRSQGLITLQRVTVDGTKIPGDASAEGFHREPTLQRHRAAAEAQVTAWEQERDGAQQSSARHQAARRRAARERQERLRRAVDAVHAVQRQRAASSRKDPPPEEARASETDPDVRRMKLPHGGFELAYNVQTVLDLQNELIVTTTVTNQQSDNGRLRPLLAQVAQEQGRQPEEVLADSGFVDAEDIDHLEEAGVRVIMPPKNAKKELQAGKDPYAPKRRDKPRVAVWRARMGTPPAQASYRQRCGPAERVHAWMEQRQWHRFRLRGLLKARVEALWQAWAHNVARLLARAVSGAAAALPVRAAVT